MEQTGFKIIYFIGLIIAFIIRVLYRLRSRSNGIAVSYKTRLETLLLLLAFVGMLVIPLVYIFTSLLDFANYRLPGWTRWTGIIIFTSALWLLWRAHAALGRNWLQTLELRKGHQLITSGVYKYIRHPMYVAIWLWGIAQALLLHNWIAGWSHLASFTLLYFLRVPREERMMLEQFGETYRTYMRRTGRVIPRLF